MVSYPEAEKASRVLSTSLSEVLTAAEQLSEQERRELVELLLLGLDDEPANGTHQQVPQLSEAWRQEAMHRLAEYDAGLAETITLEELRARWDARRLPGG